MGDLKIKTATNYVFDKLKNTSLKESIKLRTVSPADINVHVINAVKLLQEKELIFFNEGKRTIDKNILLWDTVKDYKSFEDFLSSSNKIEEVKKEDVVVEETKEEIKEEAPKPVKPKKKKEKKEEAVVVEEVKEEINKE